MPLFMDRHDLPGVTAEQVAQARLADVDTGAKFGVQFLFAYWFDPDQGEAFCLAKAPSGDSLTAVHKETHGLIPNEIISVLGITERPAAPRADERDRHDTQGSIPPDDRVPDCPRLDVDPGGGRTIGVHGPAHGARPDHPTRARCSTWTRSEAHGRWDHGHLRRRGERDLEC